MVILQPDLKPKTEGPDSPLDHVIATLAGVLLEGSAWKQTTSATGIVVVPLVSPHLDQNMTKVIDALSHCEGLTAGADGRVVVNPSNLKPYVPVFLAPPKCRLKMTESGLEVPDELWLSLEGGLSWLSDLPDRLLYLQYAWPDGVLKHDLHDMFVGNFRKRLGLDIELHGTKSTFLAEIAQLRNYAVNGGATPVEWGANALVYGRVKNVGNFFCWLYRDECQVIEKSLADIGKKLEDSKEDLKTLHDHLVNNLPRRYGYSIRHHAPTLLPIYIIDDNDVIANTMITPIGPGKGEVKLENLLAFSRESMYQVEADLTRDTILMSFRAQLSAPLEMKATGMTPLMKMLCSSFVLLDLQLDKEPSADPLGYTFLQMLRSRLPYLPIIVFSSYGQSKYIVRAVQSGAAWFCQKEDALKLPNYLLNLLENRPWEREHKDRAYCPAYAAAQAAIQAVKLNESSLSSCHEEALADAIVCLSSHLPDGAIGKLKVITAGGGATTLLIDPITESRQSSSVMKYGIWASIQSEALRYNRYIRPYISNHAGRIDTAPVRTGSRHGALLYTHAGTHGRYQDERSETVLVPLKKILTAEIGRKPEISVSFEHVRPVFATLFDHILAPLHFTKPDNTYPDLQFDEFGSVGNALEMRLPPFCEVEAIAITAPDPSNHTFISSDLLLGEQPFSVTFAVVIDFNDASLDCIVPTSDEISSLRRIRLIGPVAAGHAKYRWIRPFMPVAFTGIAKVTRNSVLNRLANDAEWADIGKDVEILRRRHMNKSAPQGIVHGDLNLGNIMLDVSDRGLLPGVTPWLIDFARSRRDFLVHDFAELECDILTEIGVLVQGQGDPVTTIKGILDDCNKTAWDASTLSDTPSIRFLIDAVRSIRRAALCRGIDLHDYLTTLALYLIVKAKLLNKKKDDKASGRTRQTIRMAKQISDQVRQYHRSEPEPITPAECSCGRL